MFNTLLKNRFNVASVANLFQRVTSHDDQISELTDFNGAVVFFDLQSPGTIDRTNPNRIGFADSATNQCVQLAMNTETR